MPISTIYWQILRLNITIPNWELFCNYLAFDTFFWFVKKTQGCKSAILVATILVIQVKVLQKTPTSKTICGKVIEHHNIRNKGAMKV